MEGFRPSDVLPPNEERKIIHDILDSAKMKAGQNYYVINAKWWSLWKDYVKYDESEPTFFGQRPDKIDNDPLLEEDPQPKSEDVEKAETRKLTKKEQEENRKALRKGLAKGFDYEVLPEEAWMKLLGWYGGGPEILRVVISVGLMQKPYVELYPLSIKLIRTPQNTQGEHVFLFSRSATIKEVRRVLGGYLYLPPHKCTVYFVESPDKEPTALTDLSKTLQDLEIEDGQPVVLGHTSDLTHSFQEHYYGAASSNYTYVRRELNKEGTPPVVGATGLYNLGNTCFMNSILQCLSNTSHITDYFTNDVYTSEINTKNPLGTKGQLAKEFGAVLKDLWSGKYLHVVPRDFKRTLGNFAPQFSGYQQQDSQELLAFLLDGLHEDLNRVIDKPSVPDTVVLDGEKPDVQIADEAWQKHFMRNSSYIVDLFHGQLKSTCNKASATYDPFMYLSLPIPTSNQRIMEVVFWPIEGKPSISCSFDNILKISVRCGVRAPKLGEVRDLKAALASLVGKSPEQLMLADCYNGRAYTIADWKYIFDIRKGDVIYGYEVLPPLLNGQNNNNSNGNGNGKEEESSQTNGDAMVVDGDSVARAAGQNQKAKTVDTGITNLQLLQRKVIPVSKNFSRTELFGNPLILSYVTASTTHSQLYDMVEKKLREFLEFDANETFNMKDQVKYSIRITTASGRHCGICKQTEECAGCELPRDDSIVHFDANEQAISVDWSVEDSKKVFDEKRVKEFIVQHESLKLSPDEEKQKDVSLFDCINLFTTEERLSAENKWFCPQCKQMSQALKKFSIWRLPEILIIHLKRFQYTSVFRDKLNELVSFPEELDMAPFVINQPDDSTKYELYAVSNHMGGLGGGHYTAAAKNEKDKKWYYYNDTNCEETTFQKVVSSDAYILFYKRVPSKEFPFIKEWIEKKAAEIKTEETKDTDSKSEQSNNSNAESQSQPKGDEHKVRSGEPKSDESKDAPSQPTNINMMTDEDSDLALAIKLSREWNGPEYDPYQWREPVNNNMQIVPYKDEKMPVSPGDAMETEPTHTSSLRNSGLMCQACGAPQIDYEMYQVHLLTDCPSMNHGEHDPDIADIQSSKPLVDYSGNYTA